MFFWRRTDQLLTEKGWTQIGIYSNDEASGPQIPRNQTCIRVSFLIFYFFQSILASKKQLLPVISDAYFWCSFLTEISISARHKGFGVRILWFQIFTYKLGKLSISRFCVLSVKSEILLLLIFNNFIVFVLLHQGLNELLHPKKRPGKEILLLVLCILGLFRGKS